MLSETHIGCNGRYDSACTCKSGLFPPTELLALPIIDFTSGQKELKAASRKSAAAAVSAADSACDTEWLPLMEDTAAAA